MKFLVGCLLALCVGILSCSFLGCSGGGGETMSAPPDEKPSQAAGVADDVSDWGGPINGDNTSDGGDDSVDPSPVLTGPSNPSPAPYQSRLEVPPNPVTELPIAGPATTTPNVPPPAISKSQFSKQNSITASGASRSYNRSADSPVTGKGVAKFPGGVIKIEPVQNQPADIPQAEPAEIATDQTSDSVQNLATMTRSEDEIKTVSVFYGTDRLSTNLPPSSLIPAKPGVYATIFLLVIAVSFLVFNRVKASIATAAAAAVIFAAVLMTHNDSPNRQGVTYGGQRGAFVRGLATVTIPATHQRGVVERPSIYRFEFEEDKTKHVVLAKANELGVEEFYQTMESEFSTCTSKDLLLFVHGFNVDFDSAVRRTAQIKTDLEFPGLAVCYSWPSQGTMIGYPIDENNVTWTVSHLREFLVELATQSGARTINVVAHSMGNRAVTNAISQISLEHPDSLPMFGQLVLAAPDVDADHFRKELAPRLARAAYHVTLYASSDDQALAASKHLHGGYPRAGESGANLVVVPDVETIDVSGIDLSLLGHSYYGSNESILRDLHELVRNGLRAHQRDGLISRQLRNATYWLLRTTQVSEAPSFGPVR